VILLALAALVLDALALRGGPEAAWWGRVGLVLFALAIVVLAWWFVLALGELLSCAEGD
jgi:hypothetical protein